MLEEAECGLFETTPVGKNKLLPPNDDVVVPSYGDPNKECPDYPPESFMTYAVTESERALGQEPKDDPSQLSGDSNQSNITSPLQEDVFSRRRWAGTILHDVIALLR